MSSIRCQLLGHEDEQGSILSHVMACRFCGDEGSRWAWGEPGMVERWESVMATIRDLLAPVDQGLTDAWASIVSAYTEAGSPNGEPTTENVAAWVESGRD